MRSSRHTLFNYTRDKFQCVTADPFLCTGIVLFDILIANFDRHEGNIAVDHQVQPRDIRIYDHDHALFGCIEKKGIDRLKSMKGRLGISAGSKSGGNRHILLDSLNTAAHFNDWLHRFETIPDWFIEHACEYVHDAGINSREVTAAIEFLETRRKKIGEIVTQNKKEFKSIRDWRLIQ